MDVRVAFLGLGAMGLPMSRNLRKAGVPLTVWNRTRERADELIAAGARAAATPADAVRDADIAFTCLPTQVEVREILTRPDGILSALRRGTIFIDCSTIDPSASIDLHHRCAEHGIAMLEAPLSGGTIGAEAGTLTMMVGGDQALLERVRPVLLTMAKNIFYVGAPGSGQALKLCNNLIAGAQTIALAEAYAILHAAGIDPKLATDVFAVSAANCVAIQQRVPVPGVSPAHPASNDWKPGFAAQWMAKDLFLVQQYARALNVPVVHTAASYQVFAEALQAGYGALDQSVTGKLMIDRVDAARKQ